MESQSEQSTLATDMHIYVCVKKDDILKQIESMIFSASNLLGGIGYGKSLFIL